MPRGAATEAPVHRSKAELRYANRAACRACALRTHRYILRDANEAVPERMSERLAARPDMPASRRESVEHPFGTIRHWMGQGALLMRGLENVHGKFGLAALACNLRRVINLMGVPALPAAVYG